MEINTLDEMKRFFEKLHKEGGESLKVVAADILEYAWKKLVFSEEKLKQYGVTEVDAAAVWLYTMEFSNSAGVAIRFYPSINGALARQNGKNVELLLPFIYALVKALRKLESVNRDITLLRHWIREGYLWYSREEAIGRSEYIACKFVSTTPREEKPNSLDKATVFNILVPYGQRVAFIPPFMSQHSEEKEVIIEPGTLFFKSGSLYLECPPEEQRCLLFPDLKP